MEKNNAQTKAALLLGRLSAKAATPKQRKDRASKGGHAAQAKLTAEERSRRARLGWEKRRAVKVKHPHAGFAKWIKGDPVAQKWMSGDAKAKREKGERIP